jgi:hypothetical protein
MIPPGPFHFRDSPFGAFSFAPSSRFAHTRDPFAAFGSLASARRTSSSGFAAVVGDGSRRGRLTRGIGHRFLSRLVDVEVSSKAQALAHFRSDAARGR